MRKDVKFGLTIGAILVVTLVIYVIVLSRGPAVPPHIGVAIANQPDQTDDSADSTAPPHTTDAAKPGNNDQPDASAVPAPDDSSSNTPAPLPPSSVTDAAPATQPAATPQSTASDWQKALDNGIPPSLSAPERTVTPTIDSSSTNMAHSGISPTASTPMIDPIPATQPSRMLMSDLPPAYAADPTPAPAPAPVATAAPMMPANPSTPAASTPRTHRVAPGESPYSISETVYGSGKYYKRILAANPNVNPHRLKIGQILIIPELTSEDKPAVSAQSGNTAVDPASSYVVASGDTLETISRKLYGGPSMIEPLYEANKTLIGPDENVLKIGWILKLPQPPTTGEQR